MEKAKQTLKCDFSDLENPKVEIDINYGAEKKLIISEYLLQIVSQLVNNSTDSLKFFKGSLKKTFEENEDDDNLNVIKLFSDKIL